MEKAILDTLSFTIGVSSWHAGSHRIKPGFSFHGNRTLEVFDTYLQWSHHISYELRPPIFICIHTPQKAPSYSCGIVVSTFSAYTASPLHRNYYVQCMLGVDICG